MSAVMLMIAMALTMKVRGLGRRRAPGLGPPPVGGAGGGQPHGTGDRPALDESATTSSRNSALSPQAKAAAPRAPS